MDLLIKSDAQQIHVGPCAKSWGTNFNPCSCYQICYSFQPLFTGQDSIITSNIPLTFSLDSETNEMYRYELCKGN